jgi:hypothetical protein
MIVLASNGFETFGDLLMARIYLRRAGKYFNNMNRL